jgi:GT2 family glycosyltransferase
VNDCAGTYIVLLNWNGWRDTLACLESLIPALRSGARIIVCDNDSSDGSLEKIGQWAAGVRRAQRSRITRVDQHLDDCNWRPAHQILSREEAERGEIAADATLILVDNGVNGGFAAGNNVGMRLALSQRDMTHLWLLNNDTVVEPDCLSAMLLRMEQHEGNAVCGAIVHFFDRPEVIQCIGGNRFDFRRARALESEGRYLPESALTDVEERTAALDYLSGCCMLLPRAFLEDVGLMSEDYFLYYEEIDWFTRANGRYDILVASDAHLYHREGSSIGSRTWRRPPSLLADHHMFRSRRIFVATHYPQSRLWCAAGNWMDVGKRLLRGHWRNAAEISRTLLAPANRTGA